MLNGLYSKYYGIVIAKSVSITSSFTPEAWATLGTDTSTSSVTDGAFNFANAGACTVIIGTKAPFKPATVTDVKVEEGKSTDLGAIKSAH